MYVVDTISNGVKPKHPIAMSSISQPTSLEQWHRRLAHCSPTTIQEMEKAGLMDGLCVTQKDLQGKCKDCILGRQTRRPFDDKTEKTYMEAKVRTWTRGQCRSVESWTLVSVASFMQVGQGNPNRVMSGQASIGCYNTLPRNSSQMVQ